MLGGLLGAPEEIRFAHLSPRSVSIDMRFGEAECHLSWVDLPGIARYRQELCFYAPAERLTLELPSPFLRSMPSRLFIEERRSLQRAAAGSARKSFPTRRRSSVSSSSSRTACAMGASRGPRARTACATCGSPRRSHARTPRARRDRPGAMVRRGSRRECCDDASGAAGHAGRRRRAIAPGRCVDRQCSGQLRRVRDHGRRRPERSRSGGAARRGARRPATSAIDLGPVGLSRRPAIAARRGCPSAGSASPAATSSCRSASPPSSSPRSASSTRCSTCSTSPAATTGRRGRRSPMPARRRARRCPAGPHSTARSVSTTPAGGGSRSGWRSRWRRCRDRGYEPTFHHHTATYVEAQWEIERLLEVSRRRAVPGHRSPAARPGRAGHARSAPGRIGSTRCTSRTRGWTRLEEIVAEAAPVQEIWRRRAFCPLGEGDIDDRRRARRARRDRLLGLARGRAGRPPGSRRPRASRGGAAPQPRVSARSWAVSDEPFRIALVGAGRMGARAPRGARRLADGRRRWRWSSRSRRRASDLARRDYAVFTSRSASCSGEDGLDGALIAAPTDQHLELVATVVGAGCPDPVREAGRRARRRTRRRRPTRGSGRGVAASRSGTGGGSCRSCGRCGSGSWPASSARSSSSPACSGTREPAVRRSSAATAAGSRSTWAVHEFDQTRWLTGQELSSVTAMPGGGGEHADADPDVATILARLAGGDRC